MYHAPLRDGVPTTDESAWTSLATGTIEHAGYMTVPATWDAEVLAGKGAIVLRVTGDAPSIGTEVNVNGVSGNPLFAMNEQDAKGKGYFLQNGAFSEASYTQERAGSTSTVYPLLSIRTYTVPFTPSTDSDVPGKDEEPATDEGNKPAPTGDGQPTPTEDDKPAATDGTEPAAADDTKPSSANTTQGKASASSTTKPSASLPKTGDERSSLAVAIAALGAGVALVGTALRRPQSR